ncbi:MAG: Type 1 glutamine amidotransferase-like domain-containing protein [Endomicrobium sp.]|nr:Type 1 glutamine amidotransferase-like domain-containing protein [Endomicrobium sp.]
MIIDELEITKASKKEADKIIIKQIRAGKIYIGASAGSMILSPNIKYAKDYDDFTKAPDLKDDFSAYVRIN